MHPARSLATILALLPLLSCDAAGTPPAAVAQGGASVVLCGPEEPGERMIYTARVLDYRGKPLEGASVQAYHADRGGLYNPRNSPTRVPRIRGVAITGADGRVQFSTIRPGPYPEGTQPAHIHVTVTAPAHRVLEMEYWFEDDPLVTPQMRERVRGGSVVIVKPERRSDGSWFYEHEIALEGN